MPILLCNFTSLTVEYPPDIHHDPHYKSNSNVGHTCHRGSGRAGHYGTPGSDCDSPLSLADETMGWIRENLRDKVDFVVWTGDNARHDNDEKIPRTEKDLVHSNEIMIEKMVDVFSDEVVTSSGNVEKRLRVPIVPNIGNNDIMPHNIFHAGPNRWTRIFDRIWKGIVPEEQRHTFVEGGWFSVEVIPNKLAVFSLNSMYFFKSNSAVDGCAYKDEPGYAQMDWLRVQLQLLRERKMKAILIGHIPPARTSERRNWYGSCWQKYALWLKQYRDVVVGSMYGHMNVDHFILQDFDDIKIGGKGVVTYEGNEDEDATIGISSKMDYLDTLRATWSDIPIPPPGYTPPTLEGEAERGGERRKSKRRFLREIGGPWSERYAVSLVPPSIIPVYFPTLRVIEYNISGLGDTETWFQHASKEKKHEFLLSDDLEDTLDTEEEGYDFDDDVDVFEDATKKKRKKKKRRRNKKKFKVPKPPPRDSTPGPAYANQPFTLLGYTQYFANITRFNEEIEQVESSAQLSNFWDYLAHKESEGGSKKPKLEYEIEYDTMNDPVYEMKDMTVNSYLDLARKMAKRSRKGGRGPEYTGDDLAQDEDDFISEGGEDDEAHAQKKRKRVWKTFLKRAFVGFRDVD